MKAFLMIIFISSFPELSFQSFCKTSDLGSNGINFNQIIPCLFEQCYPEIGCIKPFVSLIIILLPPISMCASSPEKVNVTFTVLTRKDRKTRRSLEELEESKSLATFAHGCNAASVDRFSVSTSLALLIHYEQVIIVDWTCGASPRFIGRLGLFPLNAFLCTANSETTGRVVANALYYAIKKKKIDPDKIIVTGHSAGSHTTHFTGIYLKERYGIVIYEIVALESSTVPFAFSTKKYPQVGDAKFTNKVMTTFNFPVTLLSVFRILNFQFGYPLPTSDRDLFCNPPNYYYDQKICKEYPVCSHYFSVFVFIGSLTGCLYKQTQCILDRGNFIESKWTGVRSSIYGKQGPLCILTPDQPWLGCKCCKSKYNKYQDDCGKE